jgi:hypothetical protein
MFYKLCYIYFFVYFTTRAMAELFICMIFTTRAIMAVLYVSMFHHKDAIIRFHITVWSQGWFPI